MVQAAEAFGEAVGVQERGRLVARHSVQQLTGGGARGRPQGVAPEELLLIRPMDHAPRVPVPHAATRHHGEPFAGARGGVLLLLVAAESCFGCCHFGKVVDPIVGQAKDRRWAERARGGAVVLDPLVFAAFIPRGAVPLVRADPGNQAKVPDELDGRVCGLHQGDSHVGHSLESSAVGGGRLGAKAEAMALLAGPEGVVQEGRHSSAFVAEVPPGRDVGVVGLDAPRRLVPYLCISPDRYRGAVGERLPCPSHAKAFCDGVVRAAVSVLGW